ncbi:LexA family protein [Hymenobacter sp. DG25A]|uniref:LexA family protein n=1 Tax=Hymenobacter sp. DG25A TaxID=1385663 RepID=UPI0006BD6F08|nr:translesion error-prone DNA polymerase V autoproteolytic subunit [Hymenobacter sp. DG25A]ALD21348.1 hypothetical protein AM218_09135 [Hymenobacter sp. DG25A]
MSLLHLYRLPDEPWPLPLPVIGSTLSAGFPSPADDHLDPPLDLNRHLFRHPAATYLARVRGNSMLEAGIHDGDLIAIDRALTPRDGHVVVAVVEGEYTIKRLRQQGPRLWLEPANAHYQNVEITGDMSFTVRGVVTHVIHALPPTC